MRSIRFDLNIQFTTQLLCVEGFELVLKSSDRMVLIHVGQTVIFWNEPECYALLQLFLIRHLQFPAFCFSLCKNNSSMSDENLEAAMNPNIIMSALLLLVLPRTWVAFGVFDFF